MDWTWFHRLASPPHVYRIAGTLTPWFAWPAGLLIAFALYGGLVLAPPDYQQGESVRITGAKRDDLQAAMALIKKDITEVPLEFNNFRD